jgi:hypothetical protein
MTALVLTTLASPSWLSVWEWIEFISIIVIGAGCFGEGWAEHHNFSDTFASPKPVEYIKDKVKRWAWRMVVGGLAIEMVAFGFAFQASNNEILALQAKLQPRTITPKQIKDFIFLTGKIGKQIPIKIHASSGGDDTMSFAIQLRYMLDRAGFKRDASENGVEINIAGNPITFIYRKVGQTGEWPSVIFDIYGTNEVTFFRSIPTETTNGFVRPIISEADPKTIYKAIDDCFRQIHIKTAWQQATNWMPPGECEIIITPKNN